MEDRKRSIDLEKLPEERRAPIEEAIGKKIAKILYQAKTDIDKMLDVYNMRINLVYVIEDKRVSFNEDLKKIDLGDENVSQDQKE
jgi:hypothetical protein